MIDEATSAALARLTENEKECLHRRLRHQTAKEMALDLGVSPHAVEKRLKMARAKLGVSSSLEAAQMLECWEGYHRSGSQLSDLEMGKPQGKKRLSHLLAIGAIVVSITAAALIFFAAQAPVSGNVALDPKPEAAASTAESPDDVPRPGMRKASQNEVSEFLSEAFSSFDKDKSGYLDPAEILQLEPTGKMRDPSLPPPPSGGSFDKAASDKWLSLMDRDRDGRVSQFEYVSYMLPYIMWQGIPEDWKPRKEHPG